MHMGAAMMRSGSNLYLPPALIGLIIVTVLSLGAIAFRALTVPGPREVRTHTTTENGGRVTLDSGVADLRGSLP
jgi:hypothetical protein